MLSASGKGRCEMSTIAHRSPLEVILLRRKLLLDSVLACAGPLLVTGLIFCLKLYPRVPNISIIYLLVVLGLASTRGRYSAILASLVAFLSFDFFIVPPLFTFVIYQVGEWIALFVFLITAIVTSQLAVALRRRAEQEARKNLHIELLQRTDALRAALLSSVSHDLRTPLTVIKAAASSLLQEDVQWDDEVRLGFAHSIEREADRLNRLVGNLLDLSRIEEGVLQPKKEWYHLAEIIQDVLGRMQPILLGRPIQLHLPADLPPVELDYVQIDQVLTNLIENAIRYTPADSPIEIDVRQSGAEFVINVADRGPGIPPDAIERVFDKFYRVLDDRPHVATSPGSGLGLAVCRGIVEAHSGRIWAEAREGGGVVFRIALPARKPEWILV
jgi:K+-sensing histidine kinase KdpD